MSAKIVGLPTRAPVDVNPDPRMRISISTNNLTENQKNAGLVAKVQLKHPAFVMTVDIRQSNRRAGSYFVSTPSQKSTGKDNKPSWYACAALDQNVQNYILYLFEHRDDEKTSDKAWYLDELGEHTTFITMEPANEALGITDIELIGDLSDEQVKANMVCKAHIHTTVGTLFNYTVFESTFGMNQLFGNAPQLIMGTDDNGKDRTNPAYRLTELGTMQVLNFIHNKAEFDGNKPERKVKTKSITDAVKKAVDAKTAAENDFQDVGDAVFGADA
jgi:hypothetical protein